MEIERDVPGLFIAKSTDNAIFAFGGAIFGMGFAILAYFSYLILAGGPGNAFAILTSIALIICGMAVSVASNRIRIVAETGSGKISIQTNSILNRGGSEFRFSEIDLIRYSEKTVDVPEAHQICLEIRTTDGRTRTISYPAGPDLDRERWIAGKIANMGGIKITR